MEALTADAWLAMLATVGALAAMAVARVAAERALVAALVALVLARVVSPERALAGLANPGMVTVALLFVVAAGVRRSGALGAVVTRVLGAPKGALGAQLRLMLPVAGLSAFLNNTPVVAMLMPEVRRWGDARGVAPSYLLLPLSYAAIVGGMCTLVGTSTNLLLDGLLVERGHDHLGLFWITALGVPAALAAIAVVAVLGRRLLPERRARDLPLADPRRFTAELVVEPGGNLVGKRLGDVSVPGLRAFAPVELQRGTTVFPAPRADHVLADGDRLIVNAGGAELLAVHRVAGLAPADGAGATGRRGPAGVLVQVVIGPRCPLVGHEVGDGSFRRHYGAAVVAVARGGARTAAASLGAWQLAIGDTVLLEADPAFIERHRHGHELVLVSDHGRPTPHAPWHAGYSLAVVVAMAAAAAVGAVSMLVAALAAAAALWVARVITWDELAADIEWRVLLAIVAALGLGAALADSGAAAAIAHGVVGLGGSHPWVVLAMVYLATAVTTELVTNNAAAVLMLPIALDTAAELGASPLPFVAVVMIAASASFITPIGYQTNLMVFGPGGYRFADLARLGTPVALAVAAVTLALAPLLWPL
ncbi:MAG: SLC13 family permease [Kofleriaceae bacterium]|nr:SLC13 family permease [Kofleriaceae bacterium]MCL4226734.1 anion permease [Myxococcales bacterium]